jgi:ribose-phosphate pyrophosphokinase
VTLNTIPIGKEKMINKITTISVAGIFAQAIERIYGDMSISKLFTQEDEY